jgi:hypothetical protein
LFLNQSSGFPHFILSHSGNEHSSCRPFHQLLEQIAESSNHFFLWTMQMRRSFASGWARTRRPVARHLISSFILNDAVLYALPNECNSSVWHEGQISHQWLFVVTSTSLHHSSMNFGRMNGQRKTWLAVIHRGRPSITSHLPGDWSQQQRTLSWSVG